MSQHRTISVEYLARVEGEGALHLVIEQNKVMEAKLKIFEPPRFFEAFLQGRDFKETPDITARICGICPVAYQMSAVHALEQLCEVALPDPLHKLRRLLYCGEWIESHVLHIYMLHAPDFLGYPDAITLAKDHRAIVERGLKLKKIGNDIIALVGGREIHPINVRVGGFYQLPTPSAMEELAEKLRWARQAALDTIEWVSGFPFIDYEQDYEFVSLKHPDQYPMNQGLIASRSGLQITAAEYEHYFDEHHVAHSNALQASLTMPKAQEPTVYFTGPMARYFHNASTLPDICQQAASSAGLSGPCHNPFKSIIIRAIEVLFATDEALKLASEYQPPAEPFVTVTPRQGTGRAATEAPRGILWHRYDLNEDGSIAKAIIVPPTSQNQGVIEKDMACVAQQHIAEDDDTLKHHLEQAIRNYDPCISCATHFLDLTVERRHSEPQNKDQTTLKAKRTEADPVKL